MFYLNMIVQENVDGSFLRIVGFVELEKLNNIRTLSYI